MLHEVARRRRWQRLPTLVIPMVVPWRVVRRHSPSHMAGSAEKGGSGCMIRWVGHSVETNDGRVAAHRTVGGPGAKSSGSDVQTRVDGDHISENVKYGLLIRESAECSSFPRDSTYLGDGLLVDLDQILWLRVHLKGFVEAQSSLDVITCRFPHQHKVLAYHFHPASTNLLDQSALPRRPGS